MEAQECFHPMELELSYIIQDQLGAKFSDRERKS
jgi:hypothetical protein